MQKYIVEQLLSSFHARALLHAVIVEPIGSQPDFILFIFMTLKTPNIFSCLSKFQIYLFLYSFNGDKTCKYDKYTHTRMKINKLKCFIICPAQQPSNMRTRIVWQ